jgi:hypothetical protein
MYNKISIKRNILTIKKKIHREVSRAKDLSAPLYTSDLPQPEEATVASFADLTAIMAVDGSIEEATEKLQRAVDKVSNWTRKWLVKLNEAKSVQVDFTNRRCQHTVFARVICTLFFLFWPLKILGA